MENGGHSPSVFICLILRFLFVDPDYFIGNSLLLFDNKFSKTIAAITDRRSQLQGI